MGHRLFFPSQNTLLFGSFTLYPSKHLYPMIITITHDHLPVFRHHQPLHSPKLPLPGPRRSKMTEIITIAPNHLHPTITRIRHNDEPLCVYRYPLGAFQLAMPVALDTEGFNVGSIGCEHLDTVVTGVAD